MNSEMLSLQDRNTWVLIDKPDGAKVIKSHWAYVFQDNEDGTKRQKVRLMLKGYSQTEVVDFVETFSPVVRSDTFTVLLS